MAESVKHYQISDLIEFEGKSYSAKDIYHAFSESVTSERFERIKEVVAQRSFHFLPVLEGLYDQGNISAVMRSTEAMGFGELHIVELSDRFKESARVTKGADKWLDIHKWQYSSRCLSSLKARGYQVFATSLDTQNSIADIDYSKPTAFVFGNEKDGVSPELLNACDGKVKIPMYGFVQSFNISVAAALCLSFARHQIRGFENALLTQEEQFNLSAQLMVRAHVNPASIFANIKEHGVN